jgi:hypothetical protein
MVEEFDKSAEETKPKRVIDAVVAAIPQKYFLVSSLFMYFVLTFCNRRLQKGSLLKLRTLVISMTCFYFAKDRKAELLVTLRACRKIPDEYELERNFYYEMLFQKVYTYVYNHSKVIQRFHCHLYPSTYHFNSLRRNLKSEDGPSLSPKSNIKRRRVIFYLLLTYLC